jgi:hypothetical protein
MPEPTIIDNLLESKPIQIENKPKRIKKWLLNPLAIKS